MFCRMHCKSPNCYVACHTPIYNNIYNEQEVDGTVPVYKLYTIGLYSFTSTIELPSHLIWLKGIYLHLLLPGHVFRQAPCAALPLCRPQTTPCFTACALFTPWVCNSAAVFTADCGKLLELNLGFMALRTSQLIRIDSCMQKLGDALTDQYGVPSKNNRTNL